MWIGVQVPVLYLLPCCYFFQYDTLIEDFKNVHKELETIKNSGYSTIELRKDIEEMEKEKDIVEKRIERMQRKVEGAPNVEVMMEAVKQLRAEKEKQKELFNQRSEQRIGKNSTYSDSRTLLPKKSSVWSKTTQLIFDFYHILSA